MSKREDAGTRSRRAAAPAAMSFTVVVTDDPEERGVYNASVSALPGCQTWGKSIEGAIMNAKDAIVAYLEACAKDGDPVPREVAKLMVGVRKTARGRWVARPCLPPRPVWPSKKDS